MQEGSLFSTPSLAFIVCRLFDDGRFTVHHVFFIHSSVNGQVGQCFHVLTIVNSAAVNIGVLVFFFQFWFPQDICQGVGLLGHMVVLFLVF